MRAELVFFGTPSDSAQGMVRGIIGFAALLIFYVPLGLLDRGTFPLWWGTALFLVAFASALGVLVPGGLREAAVLGALAGAVLGAAQLYPTPESPSLAPLAVAAVAGSVASCLVYGSFWSQPSLVARFEGVSPERNYAIQIAGVAIAFLAAWAFESL